MERLTLTQQAQHCLVQHLKPGDAVIDATLGNGHDALFLATTVGKTGYLFGFDIQPQALVNTQQRLADVSDSARTQFWLHSHADMLSLIPTVWHGKIQAVMFNLGYLPGGDKRCMTQREITLQALQAAFRLLQCGGILTVMVYPGHVGGDTEAVAVEAWILGLGSDVAIVSRYASQSVKPTAPRLFVIEKRTDLL